jgi:hypothetical protein
VESSSSQANDELKHGCLSMLAQRSEETGTDSATIGDMVSFFPTVISIQHNGNEKQKLVVVVVIRFFLLKKGKKKSREMRKINI